MKKLPIIFLAVLFLIGCSSKQPKKEQTNEPMKWEHYSCDWFEFDYPPFMEVEKVRNEISDTIPGLKDGGYVFVYSDYVPYRLKFTKSCMCDVFDNPEKWRDLSVEAKEYVVSDDVGTYLGVYDQQDSIDFNGHHAASASFAFLEANGDTLVHHQLTVMKMPSKDLYYINMMCPVNEFDAYSNIMDSVFNSIVLK